MGNPLNDETREFVRTLTDAAAKERADQNAAFAKTIAMAIAQVPAQAPPIAPPVAPPVAPGASGAAPSSGARLLDDLEALDLLLNDGAVNETERDMASALLTSAPGAPSLVADLKRLYEMFKAGRVSEGTFLATKMNFLGVKGTI